MGRAPEAATDGRPELAEGYYLDNFEAVLHTVAQRYDDLLDDDELRFYNAFRGMDEGARRLYVRLISRKGPCFRCDRLHYPEIDDLDDAQDALLRAGLADRGEGADTAEWLQLLLRPELDDLARDFGHSPAGTRKGELIALLVDGVAEASLRSAIESRFEVLQPLGHGELLTFRLLFFGNLSQDWTEFVLRDLGVVRYENYPLLRKLRLFETREAIDQQLYLRRVRDEVDLCLHHGDIDRAVDLATAVHGRTAQDSAWTWVDSSKRLVHQILVRVGRAQERRGEVDACLELYAAARVPPARERRVRVLERAGRLDEALELCRTIASAPWDEGEVTFAPRTLHRLRRALGEPLGPWRRPKRPRTEKVLERRVELSVERQALEALALEGREGFFAENWLWKSLFGLAFWDIVFAPLPGAFQHPFQFGPLDLHSSTFRRQRQALVDGRLDALRHHTDLTTWLLGRFDEKYGTANAFVAWFPGARDALGAALQRVDGERLAAVCDRLSRDPGRYRRGFPDLFVLSDDAPGFELLEVKAEGDQIRPEQGGWIDYLNAHGLPTSVLRIRWA